MRSIVPLLVLNIILAGCRRDPMSSAPRLLLRTSQQAEDFRFLPVAEAGVALDVAAANLSEGEVHFHVRASPVLLPEGKPYLVAVFALSSTDTAWSPAQRTRLSNGIVQHANQHFLRAVQIVFAANAAQRASYRQFLGELRARLRSHQLLSVGVPVAWCQESAWIESLGADEVVPFTVEGNQPPPGSACPFSAEVSIKQERIPSGLRLYVRNGSPWDAKAYASLRLLAGLP